MFSTVILKRKRRAEVAAMAHSSVRSQMRWALPAGHLPDGPLLDFLTGLNLMALKGVRGLERSQASSPTSLTAILMRFFAGSEVDTDSENWLGPNGLD